MIPCIFSAADFCRKEKRGNRMTVAVLAQTLPPGVEKVTSIEGVTEYAFANGLHVLLFPDNSKPKITVNVVYVVGSRNEAYER